jgi:hypothetical protein
LRRLSPHTGGSCLSTTTTENWISRCSEGNCGKYPTILRRPTRGGMWGKVGVDFGGLTIVVVVLWPIFEAKTPFLGVPPSRVVGAATEASIPPQIPSELMPRVLAARECKSKRRAVLLGGARNTTFCEIGARGGANTYRSRLQYPLGKTSSPLQGSSQYMSSRGPSGPVS